MAAELEYNLAWRLVGRDIEEILVFVVLDLSLEAVEVRVGHHPARIVVYVWLEPGEYAVAFGEVAVVGEHDARPTFGVGGDEDKLDGVVGSEVPSYHIGAVF